MANIANTIKGVEVVTSLGPVHIFRVNFKAIREISEALRSSASLSEEDFVRLLLGSICRRGTPEGESSMHFLSASDLDCLNEGDRHAILRTLWESQAWGQPIPEDRDLVGQVVSNVRKEIDRFNEHTARLLQPLQGVLGKSTNAMFFKSAGLAAQLQELSEIGRATSLFRRAQEISDRTSGLSVIGRPAVATAAPIEPPRIHQALPFSVPKDYSENLRSIESALEQILELDRTAAEAIAATQIAVTSALLEFEARRIEDQKKESRKLFWAVVSLFLTVGIAMAAFTQDYISNRGQDARDADVLKILDGQRQGLERIYLALSDIPAAIASQHTQGEVGKVEIGKYDLKAQKVVGPESKGQEKGKYLPLSSQGTPSKQVGAPSQLEDQTPYIK